MTNVSVVRDDRKNKGSHKHKRMAQIGVAEREMVVWDALAYGKTIKQTAEELNLSVKLVQKAFNRTLQRIELFAANDAEDWRKRQLLIYNQEISRSADDANMTAQPLLDEDGEQVFSRNKMPKWEISPLDAAKIRNMGGNRLMRALESQGRLVGLLIQKHEVDIEHKQLVVIRGPDNLIDAL